MIFFWGGGSYDLKPHQSQSSLGFCRSNGEGACFLPLECGSTGLELLVATWLPCVEILSKKEAIQEQTKPSDANNLHLHVSFEHIDLVFLKQICSSLEMFGKRIDSCPSAV